MTATGWVMLAITIFGAFAYAAASIFQALGARRATSTVKAFGHPLYIIGTVLDLLAWAGSMIALSELAVYVVESVLAGSLAITVVSARVILKSRLRAIDVTAVGVSVAALTVLALSAGEQESVAASTQLRLWFCGAALLVALLGWGATKVAPPGVVAGLAGLCLGGAALVGRALTLPDGAMTSVKTATLAIVTEPLVAALLVFGVTGMMLYANALQRGQVGPVTAVLWIAEVIAPSAVAVLFLGDTVRPGWNVAALVAGGVTVLMAVLLATAPANKATAMPPPAAQPALPAAPVPALAAAATPAGRPVAPRRATRPRSPAPPLVAAGRGERVVWWGPPPIWVPPQRVRRALSGSTQPALTWAPPERQPVWVQPRPADADAIPVVAPRDAFDRFDPFDEPTTQPVRQSPWHDLSA
ncbi:hypothetical protein ODJ79_03875 [Actinoplanes sp. KI2]|uniref:hypothetical protein n=1 Tax=Actinoplanes sp. KI2 TaxID=2983315 RepID=UPI0021D6057A|nr:hypothetical protein [Actinoplanes sp. KI2]MCU7722844.1 hypothetical protein [Actinoplanes sp. KI2]